MRISATAACLSGLLFVLAACSPPAPAPIMPEPVYDKYGNTVLSGGDGGQSCRGGRDQFGPNDARAALPICTGSCGNGYTTSANRAQCVPVNRDGGQDGGGDPQRGGTQSPSRV